MIQHVLLLVVAAPLFVLSRPWIRLWRCLPLDARRWLGREDSARATAGAAAAREPNPRRAPCRASSLFSVVLLAWHVPALFDATLQSTTLHALEHTLFFCAAIMFWKQVIPSPPLRTRLVAAQRVVYADRRNDSQLGPGRRARPRTASPLQLLRAPGEPSRRHLSDRRSAARRRHNVGARLDHLPDRRLRIRPSLADGARAERGPDCRALAGEH